MKDKHLRALAINFAAAYLAHSMGIGIDYCKRKYVSNEKDVGDLWYAVAQFVVENVRKVRFDEDAS